MKSTRQSDILQIVDASMLAEPKLTTRGLQSSSLRSVV